MITIDPIKRPSKVSFSVDTEEIMKEVDQKIANLIGGAPETLDTIKELADAIENLPNLDNFVTNETLNKLLAVSKYEFVDLGLPSGLKWATCNVGATKPEEYGLYFAWGETQGYSGITNEKQFSWSDYKLCGGSNSTLTKYNNNSSNGTVDNLTTLEQVDDAAYQSDNTCRMPTKADLEELIANTTSTWETLNGVNGRRFTSKTNSNSIFVPAAGFCINGSVDDVGYFGGLWRSSLSGRNPSYGWYLSFDSDGVYMNSYYRYGGLSVRAVQEANISSKFDPKETVSKLSDLESKTVEIENQLSNVYTKEEVDDLIPTDYITEEQLTQKGYITEETINNNLSNNYYTKSEVDNMIISTLNTEV